MIFIKNIKTLIELIKYTARGFSICKSFQILELKKQDIRDEIIEFGTINYEESLIKYIPKMYSSNGSKSSKKLDS